MAPSESPGAEHPMPPAWATESLRDGLVIPAHPLALDEQGNFDPRCQRGLTRYYHEAGAGGLAVGVHTTQFEIREPGFDLLEPVLSLASETVRELDRETGRQTVMIAGICGQTGQAVQEARLARSHGYHAGLLSLAALPDADDDQLLEHCRAVAGEIPIFGFYLQPAVGGRLLTIDFWRRLAQIPNLIGIKVSPFDRYKTLDVVRAVAESGREEEIALYTGNDDTIVTDLLTEYHIELGERTARLRIVGGLLGHWACWTRAAVLLLDRCKTLREQSELPSELLTLAAQVTDCNAALFDAANGFAGCIAGIQHVLYQQGLLSSTRCLNPDERLSDGQAQELQRVRDAYPHLVDDSYVRQNIHRWMDDEPRHS